MAVQAEKPYLDPYSKSQEDDLSEKYGVPKANKDGSGVVKGPMVSETIRLRSDAILASEFL